MAAARDQAARIVRVEPDTAGDEPSHDDAAILAEQLRGHLADEPVSRRPAETPDKTVTEKPAAAPAMTGRVGASPFMAQNTATNVGADRITIFIVQTCQVFPSTS